MPSTYAYLQLYRCADNFHQHCATQTFSPQHAGINAPFTRDLRQYEDPILGPLVHPDEVHCSSFGYGYKAFTFNDGKAAHFAIPFAALSLRHERHLRLCVSNKADFLYETLEPSLPSI